MAMVVALIVALLAVPAVAALIYVSCVNRLAALDARCQTAFADIDAQLRQRADLIPGLVECVRGYAAQEAKILGDVVEARRQAIAATQEARDFAEALLGQNVGAVFSLAEKYPDLASSGHFRELRAELAASEARVVAARRFFNLAVGEYNATLGSFPVSLVAGARKLAPRRPYDLGVERVALEEAPRFRFAPGG